MIQRKLVGLSFDPEEVERLKFLSKELGMNKSEIVRQLIEKAYVDKITRQIIVTKSLQQKRKRPRTDTSSYNVQSDNEKNDDPDHTEPSLAVSLNRQDDDTDERIKFQRQLIEDYENRELENIIKACRKHWFEDQE